MVEIKRYRSLIRISKCVSKLHKITIDNIHNNDNNLFVYCRPNAGSKDVDISKPPKSEPVTFRIAEEDEDETEALMSDPGTPQIVVDPPSSREDVRVSNC